MGPVPPIIMAGELKVIDKEKGEHINVRTLPLSLDNMKKLLTFSVHRRFRMCVFAPWYFRLYNG